MEMGQMDRPQLCFIIIFPNIISDRFVRPVHPDPTMDEITKLAAKCRVATPHDVVTNSECVYTFHSPHTTDKGIVVNLSTFVGTIDEMALHASSLAGEDGGGPALFVRIRKARVIKDDKDDDGDDDANEKKKTSSATKLGMGVEGGFQSDQDKYITISTHSIVVIGRDDHDGVGKCRVLAELPYDDETRETFPMAVSLSADAIICHAGLAVKQDLTAWELDDEPKPISKYAESLPFVDNGVKISPNPSSWMVSFIFSRVHSNHRVTFFSHFASLFFLASFGELCASASNPAT
jgi:ubiquitin carboxyl-terminal hydrolase 5/13